LPEAVDGGMLVGREMARARPAVAAGALVALALAPTGAQGGGVEPKNGQYAGIGEEDLRLGFEVKHHAVGDFRGEYACGIQLNLGDFDDPDRHGRFNVTQDFGATTRQIKGRVLDASSVRGKLIAHEAAGSCPGDYEVGFYAELIDDRGGGSDGGFRPRDGRYAGAGDGSYMWFDVEDGGAVNGQVAVARGPCDSFNLPAGGSDPVGDDHRFRLEQTTTRTDVTLKGKFVAEGRVTGKAIVDTTHPACAGTYEFKYTAERFRDPG
jgi:hypothetical protein